MIITKTYKVLCVFLLVLFSFNILIHSIVLANFKLNQEFIALNLCVDKDVEESTCNGNCQLMKSMDKVDKSSPSQEDVKFSAESHITVLFPIDFTEFSIPTCTSEIQIFNTYSESIQNGFEKLPFRPPICLLNS